MMPDCNDRRGGVPGYESACGTAASTREDARRHRSPEGALPEDRALAEIHPQLEAQGPNRRAARRGGGFIHPRRVEKNAQLVKQAG